MGEGAPLIPPGEPRRDECRGVVSPEGIEPSTCGVLGASRKRRKRRPVRQDTKQPASRFRGPSRKVRCSPIPQVLRLYRERYAGFNARHFHEIARREHGIGLSYSYVKQALQQAGLMLRVFHGREVTWWRDPVAAIAPVASPEHTLTVDWIVQVARKSSGPSRRALRADRPVGRPRGRRVLGRALGQSPTAVVAAHLLLLG
jgi:hypothetical protein